MAANPVSLSFVQGDTFFMDVDWQDENGVAMNLTGSTITAVVRKEYHTEVLASFVVEETDLTQGQFKLTLPDDVTTTLPARSKSAVTSFVFDINVEFQDGTTVTPIYGYLKMQRQVTI